MKIWITGASGMLGTELASKLSSHDLLLTGRSDLDTSNENAVLNFCKQNKPDTVITARLLQTWMPAKQKKISPGWSTHGDVEI